ncbi:protein-disulfide reductase DsbD N-terminal domain-containing protein [Pedobacter punctiformis]|uniref:Protein-disulfide reductase DsbD N-terminal domain-containing protein n=1 Tax=Pedobacter punctiformis TaxID=3004097 RepID=A0ABT4L8D5_9SPHI|nr:protein-disulfide reductase DsbD N-terminal domain-containing protein [Pedobacter sp. HCMS5-2]MCZ4244178.1 protein-disulfide reductase DsbD N-terminal domain-containing protein [Pedobacter sp. HCMS5-2]
MKRSIILCCIVTLFNFSAYSQILKPVTWSYAAKRNGPTEATLYFKATIDKGWHLYSQLIKDGGPVKTTFSFVDSKDFSLLGKTTEPKPITRNEPNFKMEVSYFENSVIFQQKVKLKGKNITVKGNVEFMVCNDKQCLPPEQVDFNIPVK